MLIEHLPPTSAFHRDVAGHAWTDTEHLLAIVADRVAENTYVSARAGRMKARKPKPLQRPGEPRTGQMGDRGEHDTEAVVTYLDQYKPRGPAQAS